MRHFLLLPCLFLLSSAAHGELTDLRATSVGTHGYVWFGFDNQPSQVAFEQTANGMRLRVQGVEVSSRSVSPAHTDLVQAVSLLAETGGVVIELAAAREWTGSQAEVREGGVLVSIDLGAGNAPNLFANQSLPAHSSPDEPDVPAQTEIAPAAAAADVAQAPTPADVAPEPTATETVAVATSDPVPAPAMDECERLAQAVADDPWNERLLVPHAACLAQQGQTREANGIYRQVLAFQPENYAAAVGLAELEVQAGNADAALQLYRQAAGNARSDAQAAAALDRARALENRQ